MPSQLLTVEQIADQLGVKPGRIYKMTMAKKIPFVKIGKNVRFNQERIDNWITSRTVKNRN